MGKKGFLEKNLLIAEWLGQGRAGGRKTMKHTPMQMCSFLSTEAISTRVCLKKRLKQCHGLTKWGQVS